MKKFKIVIAAVFALCLVEGVWAIAPGGALGGGGKAAQQHPQQEVARVSAPAESAGPSATDVKQMESSGENANANITPTTENQPKVAIGKTSTEGQSANEFDDAGFAKVAADNDSKRASRKSLKDALKKYRESAKSKSPDSPLDDTEMILLILLAILLPPLAVYLFMNDITTEFWICLLLTVLLVWIGGIIYALYVILR
jgi:uncharacterized membrane protein YqaE (UPF0057 family)